LNVLAEPVVACREGRLYNKESILEFILDRSSFGSRGEQIAGHIKGKRDMVSVAWTKDHYYYKCPLTGRDLNGTVKFILLWRCGCLLAEAALSKLEAENCCPACGKEYDPSDLVAFHQMEAEPVQGCYPRAPVAKPRVPTFKSSLAGKAVFKRKGSEAIASLYKS